VIFRLYRRLRAEIYVRLARLKGIRIGTGVYIDWRSQIQRRNISIGDYTRINGPISISGGGQVVIGKYGAIGSEVRIISTNHLTSHANLQIKLQRDLGLGELRDDKGGVHIGNNVWIGDRAIILSGVTVGDGAVIGAGSIVTKSVPAFAIVAGVPARLLRYRFSGPMIRYLLHLAWWDWPRQRIIENHRFFGADLAVLSVDTVSSLIIQTQYGFD